MTGADEELALLRQYEPLLAYTKGERFFPADVDDYVGCCSLWRRGEVVVPAGELTVERLVAAAEEHPDAGLSLLFVQRPFDRAEVRRHRTARPSMATTGRLAAVGLIGRVFDVLLRVSLLLRGSVPGGVAAAAADLYEHRLRRERSTYYGRVVRQGGYVVLQYWFLYAMNDWRTTFGGVNDHEADWEAVTVYLAETPAGLRPSWVAVSSHDKAGDDLRRRWDDPDLRRVGDHPVVYVGAGSHSGAVVRGQYVVTVNPVRLRAYVRGAKRVSGLVFPWTRHGRRYGVGIPFLDYALGDGDKIGPGREHEWRAVLISDDTPWVRAFRGLWGRDTRDWFGGERAPAGPRYERDGRVRPLWADPLGWAGLQKVAPDREDELRDLRARVADLKEQIEVADAEIETGRAELRRLRATALSLRHHENTKDLARRRFAEVERAEAVLTRSVRTRAELAEEAAAHQATLARPPEPEGPHAHLREPLLPYLPSRGRTRFLHAWAALSTPLFILGVVAIFVFPNEPHSLLLGALFLVFIGMEAWARSKLLAFVMGLALLAGALALVTAVGAAAIYGGRYVLLAPLVAVGGVLLVINLRDLFRR